MNDRRKATRQMLQQMAPSAAIPYIKSFLLPEEEEVVLIRHNCKRESLQQIAFQLNLSVDAVKERHARALEKISRAVQ